MYIAQVESNLSATAEGPSDGDKAQASDVKLLEEEKTCQDAAKPNKSEAEVVSKFSIFRSHNYQTVL